jgi:hypothetical protein
MQSIRFFVSFAVIVTVGSVIGSAGCAATKDSGFSLDSGFSPDGGQSSSGGSSDGSVTSDADGSVGTFGDGSTSGLQYNVPCPGNTSTTVTGKVYDPAGKNPLYHVAVYVPAVPLVALPRGVPTGADACSCGALYKSGAVTNTRTGADGSFTLTNVPVGANVPLVIQIGKWRHLTSVSTTACQNTAVPGTTLKFPSTVPAGEVNDNIPDIAVSTGGADTLECLLLRVGIASSEYVPGASTAGHVHIFAGGGNWPTGQGGPPGLVGSDQELPAMPGAPASPTSLWASQAQLMPFDAVLLSCEGFETYNANPPALESYLNAGGRAFASHWHSSWFSGPVTNWQQSYTAPPDWGSNLATWSAWNAIDTSPTDGVLVTTLNGSGKPFPKGQAFQQWMGNVGALGVNASSGDVSIYQPKGNAVVGANNKPSQPWITSSSSDGTSTATMYFSFDTPVNAPVPADGGAPNYCGRAVFSGLHVSGDPTTNDTSPPPGGCDPGNLSPQEKALEFMLFDLSSCVIPDTIAPPDAGPPSQ